MAKPTITFVSTSFVGHELGKEIAKAVRKELGNSISVRTKGPRKLRDK